MPKSLSAGAVLQSSAPEPPLAKRAILPITLMGYYPVPDWLMPDGLPSTWSSAQLEVHIRGCAASDRIDFLPHLVMRGAGRNIEQGEARRAAKYGTVLEVQPAPTPFTGVRCKVSWTNPDNETTVVIVVVSDAKHDPRDPYISLLTNY